MTHDKVALRELAESPEAQLAEELVGQLDDEEYVRVEASVDEIAGRRDGSLHLSIGQREARAVSVVLGWRWCSSQLDVFDREVDRLVWEAQAQLAKRIESNFRPTLQALANRVGQLSGGERIPPMEHDDARLIRPLYLLRQGRDLIQEERWTEAVFRFVTAGETALREWVWKRGLEREPTERHNRIRWAVKTAASEQEINLSQIWPRWDAFWRLYELRNEHVFHGHREATQDEARMAETTVEGLLTDIRNWLREDDRDIVITDLVANLPEWQGSIDQIGYKFRRLRLSRQQTMERLFSATFIRMPEALDEGGDDEVQDLDLWHRRGIADMAFFACEEARQRLDEALDQSQHLWAGVSRALVGEI